MRTHHDCPSSSLASLDLAGAWACDRHWPHYQLERNGAMSVQYSSVKWNRNKRIYDIVLASAIGTYLGLFFAVGKLAWTGSDEILLLRALGTCAFLLLHIVLCIG